jgi:hypothetical protein
MIPLPSRGILDFVDPLFKLLLIARNLFTGVIVLMHNSYGIDATVKGAHSRFVEGELA